MSVTQDTVRRIAHLARIRVEDAEIPSLTEDLNRILAFVEQLDSVDTGDVEAMTSVVEVAHKRRTDAVNDGGYQERVLENAPAKEFGFFAVPKVIE